MRERAVYERPGDVRSQAVVLGKIADIIARHGELEQALAMQFIDL